MLSSYGFSKNKCIDDELIYQLRPGDKVLCEWLGYKPKSGIIYLRWNEFSPDETGIFLDNLFKNQSINFENSLTVVDKNNIRQRKY